MQWLLHGSVAPAAVETLRRYGHEMHTAAEAELTAESPADQVLAEAGRRQWDICTDQVELARAPYQGAMPFGRCIVLIQSADHADAIERLFARFKRLKAGRLYTITASGVKVRQLPARQLPVALGE